MLSRINRKQSTCISVSEYAQTPTWILSHETYLAWLKESDPCMLYIYGQCGVGKTTLSSFLWNSLRAVGQAGQDDAVTTLYFSFRRGDNRLVTTRNLLSSIVYQLLACQPRLFFGMPFRWSRRSWPLTDEELWMIFRSLVSTPTQQGIICVIDAIDECNAPLITTLQELLAFSRSRETNFKMIATSRVSPESFRHPSLFSINLDRQKEIGMDLQATIKMQVHDLLQRNEAFLEFEDHIVQEFQKLRTHLEVVLGFEHLKTHTLLMTPRSVRNTLQALGCKPSDVCDRILNKLTDLPSWAHTALCWILLAFRPLTCNELAIAITIRDTTTAYSEIENDVPRNIARGLKHVFGGILSINCEEIRFIHQSIQDYLRTNLTSSNPNRPSLDLTHFDLARHCLTYLSFTDVDDTLPPKPVKASSQGYSPPGKLDLLCYAAEHWPAHYQKAECKRHLSKVALDFLKNNRNLERWNEYRPHERPKEEWLSRPLSTLQVAAELGLTEIVTMLLSPDGGYDITQHEKNDALDMAVENSHLAVAVLLLDNGATSTRALNLAARHGNPELVQLLVESDTKGLKADGASEIDGASEYDRIDGTVGFSPFHTAALRGQTAIISILLAAGVLLRPVKISGDTPFSLAVKGGHLSALMLLRAHGNAPLADSTEFSLLHLAASRGHLEIVRELIRLGADSNAIGKDRSTPLLLAAAGGHVVLVKDLINKFGADPNAANETGSRAVHVSAVNGHVQVFEQLCKAGTDIDAKDNHGSQPIHLAANGGHLGIAKVLLREDLDPNTVDGRKLSSLFLATRGGFLGVVQELLKHPRIMIKDGSDPEPPGRVGTGGLVESARKEGNDCEAPKDDDDDASTDEDDAMIDSSEDSDSDEDSSYMSEPHSNESDDEPPYQYKDRTHPSKPKTENEATPLHSAAERGYAEIVRELLNAKAPCNIRSKHNLTPLHLAAKKGYVSVVMALLHHEAEANTADVNKSTPLHEASITGNLAIVKALLDFGADVNKTDNEYISPLHHAARCGHIDVVRQLLEAGAVIEAASDVGETPLHNAVSQRNSEVVAALLAGGANPDTGSRNGWTALHFAVSGKEIKTDVIMPILRNGVNVHAETDKGSTALFLAAENGSEAAVEILLDAGAKADARNTANSTPMHRAAQGGHLAVVKSLIEAGANPLAKKRRDITPLQLALENRYFDVAMQLLERTKSELPSIEDYEESLWLLAREGFEKGVTKVLGYPLHNLNREDPIYNQSPLSHAAENGHERVVQILLDKHVEKNSADKNGYNALMWAVINEHQAVAEQLLARGADIHRRDHDQWTALHFAIENRNTSMVDMLLDMGADVSARVAAGNTPLHLAIFNEAPALVQMLVKKGASMASRKNDQDTPLEYAVALGNVSMVEVLLDLGASFSTPFPRAWTAIHEAVNLEDESLLNLLLHRCSDDFVGQQGLTRLHLAALSGEKSSVREQLEKGVDGTAKDHNGLTALHWAAARSHEDVVRLLMQKGADIEAKDNEGMTALHHAASRASVATIRALLESGAERNLRDLHGWTALQIAQMYANNEAQDTLSDEDETTIIPGTRYGLMPSRWVETADSPDIFVSENGLTVQFGKTRLFLASNHPQRR